MHAFLLVSYGAPEFREDVLPFLQNLFAGKNVSQDRIESAAAKYDELAKQTGRFSPLNDECRDIISGLLHQFRQSGKKIPVYWGNLFWHPLLDDTVAEMAADGITSATCFVTSAFDSPAGNRRYSDALEAASQKVNQNTGQNVPILKRSPLPCFQPLFIEAQADRLLQSLAWSDINESMWTSEPPNSAVFFTAHSIPVSDAEQSEYVPQLNQVCAEIAAKCGVKQWQLVFQSRGIGSRIPWLEPDVKDAIRSLAAKNEAAGMPLLRVIVLPVGFFCESMETVLDLDIELGDLCEELGIELVRAKTAGTLPKMIKMMVNMGGEN
ncbi:MAG: ferrochelatase [Thermoguttaceae bacterium]